MATMTGGDDAPWGGRDVVVVVGHLQSGSLRVARLLERHPDVAVTRRPSSAEISNRVVRFLEVAYGYSARELGPDRPDGARAAEMIRGQAEARSLSDEIGRRLHAFTLTQSDGSIVVEHSPGLSGHLQDFCRHLPTAQVVVVVRDPRHLLLLAQQDDVEEWLPCESNPPMAALELWNEAANEAVTLAARLQDQVMVVRYEDLDDPAAVMARLVQHAGLTFDGAGAPPTVPGEAGEVVSGDQTSVVLERCAGALADLSGLGITWSGLRGGDPGSPAGSSPSDVGLEENGDGPVAPHETDRGDRVVDVEAEALTGRVAYWVPQPERDLSYRAAWSGMYRAARENRELIGQLFKRDFLATYRKSLLGLSWLVIAPVLALLQWVVVRNNGVIVVEDTGVPYAVFVLMGITIWGLFIGFYTAAKGTLSTSGPLLLQIRFPREALIFKQFGPALANFLIALLLNFVVMAWFGVVPAPEALLLPLVLIPLLLLASAIGLFVALVAVVAVDVDRFLTVIWGVVLWMTPIVYTVEDKGSTLQTIVDWNPLTYLVLSARDIVLYGELYEPVGFAIVSLFSLVAFVVAGRLFFVAEPQLIERLV